MHGVQARRSVRRDGNGNVVAWLRADRVPEAIEFRLAAVLERVRADGPAVLPAAALVNPQLLRPTRLTAADDRLRALADGLRSGDDTPLESAQRVCDAVHAAIAYEYGVTTVLTTAAEALALGRGVCQDSAHVMLAVCHLLGLPARYVSGHLLGQGGTHAWVEVIVARGQDAMAVAFDPCNGRRAGAGYVTVATGRDYGDVAPGLRLVHRLVARAADRQPAGGCAGRRLTPPLSALVLAPAAERGARRSGCSAVFGPLLASGFRPGDAG